MERAITMFTTGYLETDEIGVGDFWDIDHLPQGFDQPKVSADTTADELIEDFDKFWDQLPREFNSLSEVKESVSNSPPVVAVPRAPSRPSTGALNLRTVCFLPSSPFTYHPHIWLKPCCSATCNHIERMKAGRELAMVPSALDLTMKLEPEANVGPPSLPEDVGKFPILHIHYKIVRQQQLHVPPPQLQPWRFTCAGIKHFPGSRVADRQRSPLQWLTSRLVVPVQPTARMPQNELISLFGLSAHGVRLIPCHLSQPQQRRQQRDPPPQLITGQGWGV